MFSVMCDKKAIVAQLLYNERILSATIVTVTKWFYITYIDMHVSLQVMYVLALMISCITWTCLMLSHISPCDISYYMDMSHIKSHVSPCDIPYYMDMSYVKSHVSPHDIPHTWTCLTSSHVCVSRHDIPHYMDMSHVKSHTSPHVIPYYMDMSHVK